MRFLFKYPSYGRPDWFNKTLETYYSMLSNKHEYEFIITLNSDDASMNTEAIKKYLQTKPNLKYYYGNHKTKIEAVNADMQNTEYDVLFLISDDMIPQKQGFDDVIATDMLKHFPDYYGALHYNDGYCGKDKCITLTIMGKPLYDYFGYIYHPSYKSIYCDNEFTDMVYTNKKVKYIPEVLVKHIWAGASRDFTYKKNSKFNNEDKDTYNKRKNLGFPK